MPAPAEQPQPSPFLAQPGGVEPLLGPSNIYGRTFDVIYGRSRTSIYVRTYDVIMGRSFDTIYGRPF